MLFRAGTSFFIAGDSHLWFIISDPAIDASQVVWVNLTSYDPNGSQTDAHNDPSCIIMPGEHGHVQHSTCVSYHGAHWGSISQLETRKKKGRLKLCRELASKALLAKMRYGASTSPHLKFEAWQILEEQGLFQDLPE